ncbi:Hypothetical predicted protein, partial [Paramuricea clavata]
MRLHSQVRRFPENVRDYLIAKFNEGQETGKKADPVGIETEMRRVRHTDGQRIFAREEWLKASQIKGFFLRLAASRRKQMLDNSLEDISEEDVNEVENEIEEEFLSSIHNAIGLTHPIMYDNYNICKYFVDRKLNKFTVPLLKEMLTAFEVEYGASDRKPNLLLKIEELVKECSCFSMQQL